MLFEEGIKFLGAFEGIVKKYLGQAVPVSKRARWVEVQARASLPMLVSGTWDRSWTKAAGRT